MAETTTITTRQDATSRPYDAVYDPNYFVSSHADHARTMYRTERGAAAIESVPQNDAMFSELQHHPRATVRFKKNDPLPVTLRRDDQQAERCVLLVSQQLR